MCVCKLFVVGAILKLLAILQGRHSRVFLEILAKERGVGKLQVVGNLLHGHIGEAQAILNGLERKEMHQDAGTSVHGLHQQFREVFGSNMEHPGKLIDTANATIALLYQLHKAVGQLLAMQTIVCREITHHSPLPASTQHREHL